MSIATDLPRRPQIGLAHPLGATCDGQGTNFAVYAGNAEEIDLCLFDPGGRHEMRNEINREEVRANLLHWIDGFLSVKQQTN